MRAKRIWSAIAATVLAGGLMVTTAGIATAAPTTAAVPKATGIAIGQIMPMTPYLPGHGTCTPDRDGEVVQYNGTFWECAFVAGDTPEWQWEPLPIR